MNPHFFLTTYALLEKKLIYIPTYLFYVNFLQRMTEDQFYGILGKWRKKIIGNYKPIVQYKVSHHTHIIYDLSHSQKKTLQRKKKREIHI